MKKTTTYLAICCLFIFGSSFLPATNLPAARVKSPVTSPLPAPVPTFSRESEERYASFDLAEAGLSREAFHAAYRGYSSMKKSNRLGRQRYLTICDFSQPSRKKRLYILDMEKNELVRQTYVAHGKNSGSEFASRFSNRPSSLQSSLGFYLTMNTYTGEHGLSLRLQGLEAGINDKAYRRAIVIHGAGYIERSYLSSAGRMGRSFGCPAVPRSESNAIINTIKQGTLVFIYHPSPGYLKKSRILND